MCTSFPYRSASRQKAELRGMKPLSTAALAGTGLLLSFISSAAAQFVCTGSNVTNTYNASVTDLGCWTDAPDRTLGGTQVNFATNDVAECANYCGYNGWNYSAVEYTT